MFNFLSDFNRIKIILGRRRRRDIVRIVSQDSGEDAGGLDTPVDSSITFDFVVRGKSGFSPFNYYLQVATRCGLY